MLNRIHPVYTKNVQIIKVNYNNIEYDIAYEKCSGIKSSNLIKMYCACDPRVKMLCLQIKYFSKIHSINGTQQKFISSYSFVLLM